MTPFFRRFFNIPEQRQEKQSRGSGVIIDVKAGYVVTNNHVIDKADEISITLLNGGNYLPCKKVCTKKSKNSKLKR
ncbi:MAG: hypothetical protein QM487_04270 [Candidatus Marithrix sp.]